MQYRLMSMLPLQVLRLLRLVRAVEPAQLRGTHRNEWVLAVRGRGFDRILRDEDVLPSPQFGGADWMLPRPKRFNTRAAAVSYAQAMGLRPAKTSWSISEAS